MDSRRTARRHPRLRMIHLLVNTYKHSDPLRDAELQECARINARLPWLNVVPLADIKVDPDRGTDNMEWGYTPGRLKFREILDRARLVMQQPHRFSSAASSGGFAAYRPSASGCGEDVIVIANADIYFDESSKFFEQIELGQFWALSRWENGELWNRRDSQDVWVFRGEAPKALNLECLSAAGGAGAVPSKCGADASGAYSPITARNHPGSGGENFRIGDYFIGCVGCDNRIAWEFEQAGYQVSNPSKTIRCHHLHASGIRAVVDRSKWLVPPPYKVLEPVTLSDALRANESADYRPDSFRIGSA